MLAAHFFIRAEIMGLEMKTATIVALGAGLVLAGCSTGPRQRSDIVKAPAACEDVTVQIYFEPDSAEVTSEGQAVLAQAAKQAKLCKIDRVRVLGLAEAVGAPAANMSISKQRVSAVTSALIANGLPNAEFELTAAGRSGAITQEGQAQPIRRRADVTVELSPP